MINISDALIWWMWFEMCRVDKDAEILNKIQKIWRFLLRSEHIASNNIYNFFYFDVNKILSFTEVSWRLDGFNFVLGN